MDNCLLIMERLEPKYKLEIQQVTYTNKTSIHLDF